MDRREFFATGAAVAIGSRLADSPPHRPAVVVVVLRGGADGLSIAIPYADPRYYAARPRCAIRARDTRRLDGSFGLHPALAPLERWWDAGQLGIAPAAGFPDPVRSHADAQARVAGWLTGLGGTACDSLGAAAAVIRGGGAAAPLVVDSWGWDTHVDQAAALTGRLHRLGAEIGAFTRAAGPRMGRVVLIVASEFGRSVKQNALGGTHHGHATTFLALGGPVAGGIWGHWPGIAGPEVPVTTDIRALFARATQSHTVA
jgi:uncharacterized protein (DUF1501 family)